MLDSELSAGGAERELSGGTNAGGGWWVIVRCRLLGVNDGGEAHLSLDVQPHLKSRWRATSTVAEQSAVRRRIWDVY